MMPQRACHHCCQQGLLALPGRRTILGMFGSNSAPHSSWSQVILSGYNGDHPPPDQEGFLEFARSLQAPDVYNKLKEATPLTPVMCCESPSATVH